MDYVLRKHADRLTATRAITWLLDSFEIVPCDDSILRRAVLSEFVDFEDAIVAYSAQHAGCSYIVTRNNEDFTGSPIAALTPTSFLTKLV